MKVRDHKIIKWQHSSKMLIFLVMLFNFFAATAQSKYSITGYGEQLKNGDVLYLTYKVDDRSKLDSTVVYDKRFVFSGIVNTPVKAGLYRNENPMTSEFVKEYLAIYIEPGTIKINSPDTLMGASAGGTPLNETMELYRIKLAPLTRKSRSIKEPEWFNDTEKRDTALVNATKKKIVQLYYERVLLELEFVKEHPDSYVSLEVLERNSRISRFVDEIEVAYDQLQEKIKSTPQANRIRENIRKNRQITVGMTAKDFVISDAKGKEVSLSSYKGKYVLLDFWASWCGPCREENPNLFSANEKYKDKGFTVLSVSIDTDKAAWLKAISEDKLPWTQVSDLKGNKSESYLLYGITSIPANFLINPAGVIVAKDLKGHLLQEELARIFTTN